MVGVLFLYWIKLGPSLIEGELLLTTFKTYVYRSLIWTKTCANKVSYTPYCQKYSKYRRVTSHDRTINPQRPVERMFPMELNLISKTTPLKTMSTQRPTPQLARKATLPSQMISMMRKSRLGQSHAFQPSTNLVAHTKPSCRQRMPPSKKLSTKSPSSSHATIGSRLQ